MQTIRIGNHGPAVSAIGLGASHFGRVCDLPRTCVVVDAAIDAGVTFIDTAEAYPGSEEYLGYALRGKRERVVISSKFGHPHTHPEGPRGSRRIVRDSLFGTLRRLQTDYLDMYLMHMPDPSTPLTDTLCALEELVHEGLVHFIGLSNFSTSDVAPHVSRLTCVQERYNLLNRSVEETLLPVCQRSSLGLVPAVPLASGALAGRSARHLVPNDTCDILERLQSFAQAHNRTLLELAIGWLAAQPCVGPIIAGATSADHIVTNARASECQLSQAELDTIDRITGSRRRIAT